MKKEPTNLNGFRRKLIASNLQPFFYKPISAMAMIKYRNHLLPRNELYPFDDVHQTISKNPECKPTLWREFWGILGKKINPTTRAIFQSDRTSLKIKILILLKCSFNTFLSKELSFEEIPSTKNPLIPAIWHKIGHNHKTFWNKKYTTIPI